MSVNAHRYLEIKERLIEHISSLKPHDRLPARTVLAETYQAARTTIERAISELIGEGYLYARDGSGTYVSDATNARSARTAQEIQTWGLLIPDILHYNYPDIVRAVSDVASEYDINLIICHTDDEYDKQTRHLHKLVDSKVQGVIIIPAIRGTVDVSPFYKLKEAGIPFVFCHRVMEGISAPRVISNNFSAGYIATKQFIAAGYTKIAYISRPLYAVSSERYQGYVRALTEAKLPVRQDWVTFESAFESEGEGYFSARHMLQLEQRPDGIFCFNDRLAHGAYQAAAEMGLQVGVDIGITGCDNMNICETLPTKLTSVKFQTYAMGAQAAHILFNKSAQESSLLVLEPEIIVRDSSLRKGQQLYG